MAELTSNSNNEINSLLLTPSPSKCCIPGCKPAPGRPHIALYKVMHNWVNPIKEYVSKTTFPNLKCWQYLKMYKISKICAIHVKLLGLQGTYLTESINYPHLNISVGQKSQKELLFPRLYSSEEISVGAEITLPVEEIVPFVNQKRTRREVRRRHLGNHELEHSYAISPEYIDEITKQRALLREENRILRLNQANKTSFRYTDCPFREVLTNEAMLHFYTGFTSIKNLKEFLTLLRPYYNKMPKWGKRQYLDYDNQVILVITRLKHGFLLNDMAYRYNIPSIEVSKIWQSLMGLLHSALVDITLKLNGKDLNFRHIIVELTETIFAEEAKEDYLQNYAGAKGLLELSSKGYICSTSLLYPGNVTDQQLLQRARQNLLTDEDIIRVENIKKYITGGVNSVSKEHVPNILFYIKDFKILNGTFPNSMCSLRQLHQMWKVCCFLINFINKPVINKSS